MSKIIFQKRLSLMSDKPFPYIDGSGNVVIPFNSDPQYHFWKGGKTLLDILKEMKITEEVWKKHTEKPYPEKTA